jgi:hypothetical protein
MNEIKYSNVRNVYIQARAGSVLNKCIQEAMVLAAEEWVEVILEHNDFKYTVTPGALQNIIEGTKTHI